MANQEDWIFTPEQIREMSDDELRELVVVTPLKDDYHGKYRAFVEADRLVRDCKTEKILRHEPYADALAQFKRMSVNPDGSKAAMTPAIRACRETKERLYRDYKEVLIQLKYLLQQAIYSKEDWFEASKRYSRSMEFLAESLLKSRARTRMEAARRRQLERRRAVEEQRRLRNNPAPPVQNGIRRIRTLTEQEKRLKYTILKETKMPLSRSELDAEMDDVCIICMEPHSIGQTLLTSCGHRFGTECFSAWNKQCCEMRKCVNCPMCKRDDPSVTTYVENAHAQPIIMLAAPVLIDLT